MAIEEVNVIINKMRQLGFTDQVVFKVSPIVCDTISVYGLFISSGNILWLVDGSKIVHDMFGNIKPWYFQDKHLALTCKENDMEEKLLEKLENYK